MILDMKHRIAFSGGSTLYQLDLRTPDNNDLIRFTAVMAEPHLVEWSWIDTHVKYPILKAVAWIYNKTIAKVTDRLSDG